ncbi:hypothetical protein B0E45_30675 [Sinorhizobium sp. A49]|uniref:GGDEF domain-containing protein n=1 Tax=Sinorhizobium sp. A49 TaxID=1945861 RepID=UPI0009870F8F|nr:GGDEF domain-containing protein [Sinorhizobium sp. A49]OOG62634.1 hypothetical protein B0E45_30675 [Sinorhizobium sp. A49]
MQRDVPFNGQKDWRIVRYVLAGIVGFAVLAQVLVYFSLVALVDRPYAAAVLAAALISLLMGVPLIVIAAMQFRRAQRLRNQINHVAAHDTTTGCVTGRGLVQYVNGLERRRQRSVEELQGALIHLRINNLDDVGAAFGPEWSEELLQFVASTISTSVRRDDIVARTGPASFDVLLVGATETDAEQVCARLTTTLTSSHFSADGRKVDLALSVGGALFEGSVDLERLRRAAASESIAVAAGAPESVGFVRLPSA